jgi:hypothetical protein
VTKEPHFRLRLPSAEAAALDAEWRANGQPLETLVPISFPGLKTRFDELLVDDDRERLFERITALSRAKDLRITAFVATLIRISATCSSSSTRMSFRSPPPCSTGLAAFPRGGTPGSLR